MKKDTAMEVLRERFAKGEISKEEFEEKIYEREKKRVTAMGLKRHGQ